MGKGKVTVKKIFDTFGWVCDDCDIPDRVNAANVDIGFYTPEGRLDETQFSILNPFTADGVKELDALFKDFCKENKDPDAIYRVAYAVVVEAAEELEELS